MGGSVLSYPEGIMRPDIFDRQSHQCRKPDGRFHIIAEHEESAAGGPYPAMQGNAVTNGRHGQFTDARLQECTAEIAFGQRFGLFQEPVGLVAVGKVGRRNNHISHVLSKVCENGR
ncbi:hypothetical protein DSECCO2_526960 [anaerobic digester metagenome]